MSLRASIICWAIVLQTLVLPLIPFAQARAEHPRVSLTSADVAELRENYARSPVFLAAVRKAQSVLEAEIIKPVSVPMPEDAGGGFTHEQHKRNGKSIHYAGVLYQVTGEPRYAAFGKRLLMAYADIYPGLGMHPAKKEQAPGRLFWQSLNESVWLVDAIQGYDALYHSFSKDERIYMERNLLRKMADFLSQGSAETFDKIHNHGTWATAAVGMTGYVIGDDDLVEKALLGLDRSGKGGFLRQLNELFSPDGYYTEGPYYQRYALMPFLLFAKAIDIRQPERRIFEHRDGILLKAVYTTIQLSYNDLFFPINDALKDKGLTTPELRHGVAIAYGLTGDARLLSIARKQSAVVLTGDGLKLAQAIEAGKAEPFDFRSLSFSDGARGDQGVLAILRSGAAPGHQTLVMKNTAQGMGHGHFDKLNWLFYDNGQEIIQDYGAARFLNVEAKNGGHYLPENTSWAKQTIAHNTLVVDETSHFDGKVSVGERYHPVPILFERKPGIQITGATMENAYRGVIFTRVMAMIEAPDLDLPLVLDVLKVTSAKRHQYDLPLYYNGHLIDQNFTLETRTEKLAPVGQKNGYQHLWLTAEGRPNTSGPAQITWLTGKRFYTYSTLVPDGGMILFTRLGAHDPNFNLRGETGLLLRLPSAANATFVSVLEPHGEYNPALEYTVGSHSQVGALARVSQGALDFILIPTAGGNSLGIGLSYDSDPDKSHSIQVGDERISWKGFYRMFNVSDGSKSTVVKGKK